MIKRKLLRGALAVVSLLACAAGPSLAEDPPDSDVNPQTGSIETVDSVESTGQSDVRHAVDPGQGGPRVLEILTTSTLDDLSPRIAIDTDGDSWVVWWREGTTDEVLYRVRDLGTGTWSAEQTISDTEDDSRNPEIALDDTSVWVVFEARHSGGTDLVVTSGGMDDPSPFPGLTVLGTSALSSGVDVLLHSESGHLWVSWIDDGDDVGWREYDYASESWLSAAYESYAQDDVSSARERIRDSVLPD
jgi:hypothetical protein